MELTIDQAIQQGIDAHKAGRVQDADNLYKAILKVQPKHPDANHNMGVLAVGAGEVEQALSFLKTALEASPRKAQFWLSYIDVLIKLDRLAEAKAVLDQAKEHGVKGNGFNKLEQSLDVSSKALAKALGGRNEDEQGQADILKILKLDQAIKLAKKEFKGGRPEEAKRIYKDILVKFPKNKKAIHGMKALSERHISKASKIQDPPKDQLQLLSELYSQGHLQQALDKILQLLQQFPNSVVLYNIQGAANKGLGQLNTAIDSFKQAIKINPDYARAYFNLGNAVKEQRKLEEAIEAYKKAIAIKSDYAAAYNNMGIALQEQGELEEALEALNKTLSIKPDYAEAYYNMGNALQEQRKLEEAIEAYKKAIAIKADYADAYNNMGIALKDQGKLEETIEAYKKAASFAPENLGYQFKHDFAFPKIPLNTNELSFYRDKFTENVVLLGKQEIDNSRAELPTDPRFQLSYQNCSNLEIFQNLSIAIRRGFPQVNYNVNFTSSPKLSKGSRVKVAFCSKFLTNHTIGKLFKGIISNLCDTRFEVYVIHHPKTNYEVFWKDVNKENLNHIVLPPDFSSQKKCLEALRLDTLIFTDIGMDGLNYSLAHCRFASQQIVSWGHPDTTGISTIDQFISSDLIEPYNAQSHYSEELVLFSTLPSYYDPQPEPLIFKREHFGFNKQQKLYGCLQTLFKIHPDFDIVLEKIAQKDSKAVIVFIDSPLSSSLKARWKSSQFDALLARSVFLQKMESNTFLNLMNICDVLLDPVYFGSGNTFYESAYCGVPQVSFPGELMRGRIVYGGYKQLGISECPIVPRQELYHQVAVEWANSRDRLEDFRSVITSRVQEGLFRDSSVIAEYEKLLHSGMNKK